MDIASNPKEEPGACRRTTAFSPMKTPFSEEYRSSRAHNEVVVVGDAVPHGRPQVTQQDHTERAGERWATWAGEEANILKGLRGKISLGVLHHTEDWIGVPLHLTLGSGTAQYKTGAAELWPRG